MSDFETHPVGTKALIIKLLLQLEIDNWTEEYLQEEAKKLGFVPSKEERDKALFG